MPKCCVSKCSNNSTIALKGDGITYHRFPANAILREKWRKIIANDRGEKYYKPSKWAVVCSNHFEETDLYSTPGKNRWLIRCSYPKINLQKRLTENKSSVNDSQQDQDDSLSGEKDSTNIKASNNQNEDGPELSGEANLSDERPSSSLSTGSALDTPKETVYKQKIRKCEDMIRTKNNKIASLSRRVNSLIKKNQRLKRTLKELKNAE